MKLLILSLFTLAAAAQRMPAPAYYEDTNNIPVSPELHADRRVTFRLFAPAAGDVVLMGSPGILEFTKKPLPLVKDEKGVWSLTIGPLPPGFYTYGYAIDKGLILSDGAGSEFYISPRVPKSKKLRRIRVEEGKPVQVQTEFQNSDTWLVGRDTGKADHPTQKPVELARRAITNSSKMGEIVLDPFLGSGTTLIGAEVTGRICYGIEFEPKYCDVIVARWEKLTGKKAKREGK